MYKIINRDTNKVIGIYDKVTRNQIIQEMTNDNTKFELDDNGNVLFTNSKGYIAYINEDFKLATDTDELVLNNNIIIQAGSILTKDDNTGDYIVVIVKDNVVIKLSVNIEGNDWSSV